MRKRTLEVLAEAAAELNEATDWYGERDETVASTFVTEVRRAMAAIVEAPNRWPRYEGATRRKLVRGFPFTVIYRDETSRIVIVAVAHTSRRPSYWRRR